MMNRTRDTKASAQRLRHERGQLAAGFLIVMGFVLVLVSFVVQLGQNAQIRVETSNAADAGALAATSWISSGMNEASMIGGRMWEGIELMQLVYSVPFCPGAQKREYAQMLWDSLREHPMRVGFACSVFRANDPDDPFPDPYEEVQLILVDRCGPNGYFEQIGNAVMEAAWNMGRREFLTAAINNMLIRHVTGETVDDLYGNLPAEIKDAQDFLYSRELTTGYGVGWLSWNNGRPVEPGGGFLYHAPMYSLSGYPEFPPEINMVGFRGWYSQWPEAVDIPDQEFDCSFDGAWGITDEVVGFTPTGPVADIYRFVDGLPERPLAVDAAGWKEWEKLDLEAVIPTYRGVDGFCPAGRVCIATGLCTEPVCGFPRGLSTAPTVVFPASIETNDDELVTVEVEHRVYGAEGYVDDLDDFGDGQIPALTALPEFPLVESKATANFTPPFIPWNADSVARLWSVE